MFMKTAPENIDPEKHPDLACIQSIIHDDDRTPEGVRTSAKQFISYFIFVLIVSLCKQCTSFKLEFNTVQLNLLFFLRESRKSKGWGEWLL